jgi:hypothetical protein
LIKKLSSKISSKEVGIKPIKIKMTGIFTGLPYGLSEICSTLNQVSEWLTIKSSITIPITINSPEKISWSKIGKGIAKNCKKINIILLRIKYGVDLAFTWTSYLSPSLFLVIHLQIRLIRHFLRWISKKSQYNLDSQTKQ